nr:nitroreductase family protein [Saccharopolyspora gloriosae]
MLPLPRRHLSIHVGTCTPVSFSKARTASRFHPSATDGRAARGARRGAAYAPTFTDTYGDGVHSARSQHHGATLYGVLGIARSDRERRNEVVRDNLSFYGAPHVAFLFMPRLGGGVRAASDVGMYAQNFLLSLRGRGFHGIPQAVHGLYADTVREALGVPDELKLLFGISFGTARPDSPVRSLEVGRVPLQASVVLHDTPLW